MAVLEVDKLGIAFGGLRALEDVHFKVEEGSIVGLIGPNGAGKTTVFNLLTGVYTPTEGTIRLNGESILKKKTYQITDVYKRQSPGSAFDVLPGLYIFIKA